MTKDYEQVTKNISAYIGELRKTVPDAMTGFSAMAKGALQDGALDKKTKEMIALAIGVSTRCDGCIGFHAKACVDLGATRQEVSEVLAMCVYMGGGPSLMYAADALRAYDQFAEKAAPAAEIATVSGGCGTGSCG
jgi:AhpD family alkylhydroperoxidase